MGDSFSHDFTPAFDVLIVGAGATGALVALRMAARGLTVVVLEAGPRFSGYTALQNAEANAGKIMWSEPRKFVGSDFVVPKTGTGVGGGTLPWLGVVPRFHRDDFRTFSTEGVGADWPIGYDDLRPHYETVEREFGVAGECGTFAPEPYTLPMPPHRMNWHGQVLARGAQSSARIRSRLPSRSTRWNVTAGPRASRAAGAGQVAPPKRRRPPPTRSWREPSDWGHASSARRSFIA